MELRDAPGIHICTLLPASIDTPLFQHAGNYTGRAIKPMEPVYSADAVAKAVVKTVKQPRREVIIGNSARMALLLRLIAPQLARK